MDENFLYTDEVYGRGLEADEPCIIQFTRDGQPAPVDTSKGPVRVEFEDSEIAKTRVEFLNIRPTGNKGEYEFDVNTPGATGGFTGAFVADRNMTPEGVDELRVSFAGLVLEPGADGASVRFGAGKKKAPPAPTE